MITHREEDLLLLVTTRHLLLRIEHLHHLRMTDHPEPAPLNATVDLEVVQMIVHTIMAETGTEIVVVTEIVMYLVFLSKIHERSSVIAGVRTDTDVHLLLLLIQLTTKSFLGTDRQPHLKLQATVG